MARSLGITSVLFSLVVVTVAGAIAVGCAGSSGSSGTTTTTNTGSTGSTGSTSSGWTGGGDGIWRRNAVYAEAVTFDPCNAHQPGSGEYHYHDNPVCLRYQMSDNITGTNVGTANATYVESATHTHSPILGWAFDGYPVYGPYGYSTATSATTGVRRMVSSYALRTDNTTTRTTLPAWAATYQNLSATLTTTEYGPAVSTTYPLGRYVEDYNYTAGLGDLDQYNGRFCVTPDFPNGTYAYFVTIDASGNPAFPYYLGPQFYGTASGGNVTSVTETTTNYYANHAIATTSTLPNLTSWLKTYTSQLAAILYDSSANVVTGPVTTWTGQTTAVDADVQTVSSSSDYAYVQMSGLASHMMGPWYMTAAKTGPFVNLPTNQNAISRIPLTPAVGTTKTATGGGAQGRWANGVAMFNMLDFASWSYSAQADVM
jgi:YHYH protein